MIVKCILGGFILAGALLYLLLRQRNGMEQVPLLTSASHRLVVISFDGFRYDYLSPELTPNLYYLATEEGVTGHMLSTFATKTFPNHHSIATGLYQETHGIVHNDMYDAQFGERFMDRENGSADRWWDNELATPIYIANQLHDHRRASCCSPWIGCHVHYFGQYRAHYHRHFNKSDQWNEQWEWSLQRMLTQDRPANLVLLYIPEPDMVAHLDGPFGHTTIHKVRLIDQFVGHVLARLRMEMLDSSTNVIFLSDHGIAAIEPSRMLVLESFLNSSWYEAYGCSPVYHIKARPEYHQVVWRALNRKQAEGNLRVYSKHSMPTRWRYSGHHRIHDFVVLAEEGWSLHQSEQQAHSERHHRGQHGYDNLAQAMRPLFVATGPAFKRAYRHRTQFTNVDLYPLMLQLLGIRPEQHYHQGNLTYVADMLRAK